MSAVVEESLRLLRALGVAVDDGMTETELASIEGHFGIEFGADHRELLLTGVPMGERWCDWRRGDELELRRRIEWPIEGALFDVESSSFWPRSWGHRPSALPEALAIARQHLDAWPKLLPLYSHRYLLAAPAGAGSPVYSVYQTDVIFYGGELLDYVHREFGSRKSDQEMFRAPESELSPWSRLATGLDID